MISFGEASVEEIDTLNIYHARMLAMCRAVAGLNVRPELALIDGNATPKGLAVPGAHGRRRRCQMPVDRGGLDRRQSFRDAYMRKLAEEFPGYGWETNVGYGTRDHRSAMARLGLTPHHRRSFAPVRHCSAYRSSPTTVPFPNDDTDEDHWT